MITNTELAKLKPKQIKHNNIYYYIKFNYNENNFFEIMELYKQNKNLSVFSDSYITPKGTIEDISQFYELVFTEELDIVIDAVERNNLAAMYSPTYIQDIMEKFFEMYLITEERKIQAEQKRKLQLENYENWDGVIKL